MKKISSIFSVMLFVCFGFVATAFAEENVEVSSSTKAMELIRNSEGYGEDILLHDFNGELREDEKGSYNSVTVNLESYKEDGGSGAVNEFKVYQNGEYESALYGDEESNEPYPVSLEDIEVPEIYEDTTIFEITLHPNTTMGAYFGEELDTAESVGTKHVNVATIFNFSNRDLIAGETYFE